MEEEERVEDCGRREVKTLTTDIKEKRAPHNLVAEGFVLRGLRDPWNFFYLNRVASYNLVTDQEILQF